MMMIFIRYLGMVITLDWQINHFRTTCAGTALCSSAIQRTVEYFKRSTLIGLNSMRSPKWRLGTQAARQIGNAYLVDQVEAHRSYIFQQVKAIHDAELATSTIILFRCSTPFLVMLIFFCQVGFIARESKSPLLPYVRCNCQRD